MNQGSSKSLLPLVEILISIGIFAIAVVLTLQLFLLAKFWGNKTSDTARAIFEVQNVAENIKSMQTEKDIENYIANKLNRGIIYYDGGWNIVDGESDAVYKMKIYISTAEYGSGSLYSFVLDFYRTEDYPFINNKNTDESKDKIPLLVSVDASKLILN
jgi:type II secretory pathway pseudopilin PulG